MRNEVHCNARAHHLCCLISAICELGINAVFWEDGAEQGLDASPMVRPG
jgi:hypothetical protein